MPLHPGQARVKCQALSIFSSKSSYLQLAKGHLCSFCHTLRHSALALQGWKPQEPTLTGRAPTMRFVLIMSLSLAAEIYERWSKLVSEQPPPASHCGVLQLLSVFTGMVWCPGTSCANMSTLDHHCPAGQVPWARTRTSETPPSKQLRCMTEHGRISKRITLKRPKPRPRPTSRLLRSQTLSLTVISLVFRKSKEQISRKPANLETHF